MSEIHLPIPYSDSVEEKQPCEDETIAQIIATCDRMRQMVSKKHRHAYRDAHAKSHGIVRDELTLNAGPPEELAQGLFGQARTLPVIIRLSTVPGDILPDGISGFRSLAIKVIGTEGEKVLPDECDAVRQDFLFVNHPVLLTGDVSAYLKQQTVLEKVASTPEVLQEALTTVERTANRIAEAVGLELKPDVAGCLRGKPTLPPHHFVTGSTSPRSVSFRPGTVCAP